MMRAALLTQFHAPFEIVERPRPEPGSNDVVVEVGACGVCGSDRFLQQGGFGSPLPLIPGHEAAGTVVELGANVEGLSVGDKVALYYIVFCGDCAYCRAGRENICVSAKRMGCDFDGAMADYVVMPQQNCLRLPSDIDLAAAAVITDAIGTPTHALSRAGVSEGDTVMVMGVGGIGTNAIQIARLMGARVIAVSRSDAALENALKLGADHVVRSDTGLADAIADLTDGLGVNALVQSAPGEAAFLAARPCLARGGRLVIVGTTKGPVPVDFNELLWREQEIVGSRGFTRSDILQALDWYSEGRIAVDHLTRRRRPLAEINEAIADLDNPDVVRTVIEPAR